VISNDRLDELEEQLFRDVQTLPTNKKQAYFYLQKKRCKDPDTYAALNWFFICGLHSFYIGKWVQGTINLVLMLIGLLTLGVGGGLLILLVFLVELPRLFFSQRTIRIHNLRLSQDILKELSEDQVHRND